MSDWNCIQCGKLIKPDPRAIKIGDTVTFIVEKVNARTTSYNSHAGTVVDILPAEDLFLVKGKGRMGVREVRRDSALPENAPTALTYAVRGTCSCGGES